jgi:hypothetical protein
MRHNQRNRSGNRVGIGVGVGNSSGKNGKGLGFMPGHAMFQENAFIFDPPAT